MRRRLLESVVLVVETDAVKQAGKQVEDRDEQAQRGRRVVRCREPLPGCIDGARPDRRVWSTLRSTCTTGKRLSANPCARGSGRRTRGACHRHRQCQRNAATNTAPPIKTPPRAARSDDAHGAVVVVASRRVSRKTRSWRPARLARAGTASTRVGRARALLCGVGDRAQRPPMAVPFDGYAEKPPVGAVRATRCSAPARASARSAP